MSSRFFLLDMTLENNNISCAAFMVNNLMGGTQEIWEKHLWFILQEVAGHQETCDF
jgi:hypothetical protein